MTGARIVYVSPNSPLPANRGGRIRAHHNWRALSALGATTVFVVGDLATPHLRTSMRLAGARFWPRRLFKHDLLLKTIAAGEPFHKPSLFEINPKHRYPDDLYASLVDASGTNLHHLDAARCERISRAIVDLRPDLVVICDTSLGVLAPYLRGRGARIVVGPHNHDSQLYESMAAFAPTEDLRIYYATVARSFAAAEAVFLPCIDQLWVCSKADAVRFAEQIAPERIAIVPNVVDVAVPQAPASTSNLVYVGQLEYYPNAVAAMALIEISKRLDQMGVPHKMQIVGRHVPHVAEAARAARSVEMTGEVPDVTPYVANAALVPVPLTLGGGTRLKILEAMAAARPIVSTPIGIEGIDAVSNQHAVIEPDLASFPATIAKLLEDREQANRIGAGGYRLCLERYSHEVLRGCVRDAVSRLGIELGTAITDAKGARLGVVMRATRVQFNPDTRLLVWSFQIRAAATSDALVGEVCDDHGESFPNAFVTLGKERSGWTPAEVAAILPEDIAPHRVRVHLSAWGYIAAVIEPPAAIAIETAKLLTIESEDEAIAVALWTRGVTTTVLSSGGSLTFDAGTTGSGPTRKVLLQADSLREVALLPAEGVGDATTAADRWLLRQPSTTFRLDSLKDRHSGQAAWLIGNGPSVDVNDLDRLKGKICFCFNRFYLAHSTTQLRPTYTVTADRQMIEDFGQEIVNYSGGTVFVADDSAPSILGQYVWLRLLGIEPALFSMEPRRVVNPGGSSLFVAMQLAFFMGIRRLYIYGADFEFKFQPIMRSGDKFRVAHGDGNHFIKNYRSGKPWCPPSIKHIAGGFFVARQVFEANGGSIDNASRGGRLEMFNRVAFEDAVTQS